MTLLNPKCDELLCAVSECCRGQGYLHNVGAWYKIKIWGLVFKIIKSSRLVIGEH